MKRVILATVFLYLSNVALAHTGSALSEWKEFSENEKTALKKLYTKVQSINYDDWIKQDWNLINYLRATNLNVDSAAARFKETISWRKENRIDSILNEKEFQMKPAINTESTAKNGNPVMMWRPGQWDVRKVILAGNRGKLTRYVIQHIESIFDRIRRSQAMGGNMTQLVHIVDIAGFNLREHACVNCFPTFIDWLGTGEKYYPSFHDHMFLVNTPRIFYPLLNLMKPLFSAQTAKALQVKGPDKNEWVADLRRIISDEQLPQVFGGKKPNWF